MNIKNTLRKEGGFTIVELLIVVVVIAILAAITIVSYNGITTQANASAAKSTAASWQKKLELYQADMGAYPFTNAAMSLGTNSGEPWYIPPTSLVIANPGSTNGKNSVMVQACSNTTTAATASTTTGNLITYFDYETGGSAVLTLSVGAVNPEGCAAASSFRVISTP